MPHASSSQPIRPRPAQTRLAELLLAHAPYDGTFTLRCPALKILRASRPRKELSHGLHEAALCIVAQGAKRVLLGQESYEYDASHILVASVDVPVAGQVTKASPQEPFLCLKLDLAPQRIAELSMKVYPHGIPPARKDRAIYLSPAEPSLIEATIRLMEYMAQPEDVSLLAPLVVDEILIRLLRSPIGGRLAQMGQQDSQLQRLSKAVAWVREHFDQPLDVERLATMVHMSPSSFHHHFKSVTTMSPLQYQKALRLQEARRLMLTQMVDAGSAGRQVGYVSASQFSREYGRFFGNAPTRDMARLRKGETAHPLQEG